MSQIEHALTSLRHSSQILTDMSRFGIEIVDSEPEVVVFSTSGEEFDISDGPKLLIKDVITSAKPLGPLVFKDVLPVEMNADNFANALNAWKDNHVDARIIALAPYAKDTDQTEIKYHLL